MGGAVQVVIGPAGSGKSTYCQIMQDHCATLGGSRRRNVLIVNLDPAAENINYNCAIDVRDLISVEDVMEEMGLGPNGALIFCMEYLLNNLDWLKEQMEPHGCDGEMEDYWIIDCPGQIELYTHVPIMKTILDRMQNQWGFTPGCMVSVFCCDSTFCCDAQKMLSGQLLALSAMIALELPHINILTKGDLLPERDIEAILNLQSATQLWELEQDRTSLFSLPRDLMNMTPSSMTGDDIVDNDDIIYGDDIIQESTPDNNSQNSNERNTVDDEMNIKNKKEEEEHHQQQETISRQRQLEARRRQRHRLTTSISELLDDYTMVSFVPLNINDEESIDHVLITVDHAIQYGEDLEVRGAEGDDDDIANPNDGFGAGNYNNNDD